MAANALDGGVALFSGKHLWKMLHHARIGIHGGEGRPVCIAPPPHEQPLGPYFLRQLGNDLVHMEYHEEYNAA
jgi:hypothetical protein